MALKRIFLRDFVIVDALELDLSNGFTVLTGETGAGKSILIDALQLATGSRADTLLIREGASRTEVSAEFDSAAAIRLWLDNAGFECTDSVLLRRTLDQQGKSRGWINGSPATAAQMRELGEQLLDIHGQHAWQSLTRPDAVRALLDAYAKLDLGPLTTLWQEWRGAAKLLQDARSAQDSLQRERERLVWQIGELDKLAPASGEWAAINSEHGRLSHAQALLDAAYRALELLQEREASAIEALNGAVAALQQQQHLEPAFGEVTELLGSCLAQLEDATHSLRVYQRRMEPDPQRLTQLDERLSQWLNLARRYKRDPAELDLVHATWKTELARLDAAADVANLESTEQAARAAYLAQAGVVSRARSKAAPALARAITQAMQRLGMEGGRFEVALQKSAQPQQNGLEDVAFLVAGHAGSTPRPVSKVASGGELSRIALAIAVTTSQLGAAQTLVFDEVDAGVGGAVAQTVGLLMRQLGQHRQVMAVTHLPQVAASADHHLVVSKRLQGQVTLSSVQTVQDESRVTEIARMLGGERVLGSTVAHAREMLQTAA